MLITEYILHFLLIINVIKIKCSNGVDCDSDRGDGMIRDKFSRRLIRAHRLK